MTKREAREILFTLVYESEFCPEKTAAEIYSAAKDSREFEDFRYIKKGIADIIAKRDFLSGVIEKRSDGWKISRIAPVTRSIMYVCAYDIICRGLAPQIAINEAVLLAKKYDSPEAAPFVNGVLNSVAKELDGILEEIPEGGDDVDNATNLTDAENGVPTASESADSPDIAFEDGESAGV